MGHVWAVIDSKTQEVLKYFEGVPMPNKNVIITDASLVTKGQSGPTSLGKRTIAKLEGDLSNIQRVLKPDTITFLKANAKIYVDENGKFPGVYHPSPIWLKNNGYPEYYAKSI